MYHYFNGKLDQHVMLIASLEKELELAKQDNEQLVHDHEALMGSAQSEFQAEFTRTSEEIESLRHELRQLHVFSQQKLQIETQMEELEATLVRTTKQFEEEKLELERKSIFEKDRVKKEMLLRMKETKEELLQRTDDQLNTTTKRTMMENDHFMEELSFQSKETEKLLTRYHVLEDEAKLLRVKTKMLEENEAVMAKKNYYYQKILNKLQKKEEKAALDTLVKDEEALLQLQQAVGGGGLEDKKSASEEIRILKVHVDELETTLKNAHDWIHMFQQEKQYMVAQQDEVIQFLCRAIQDAAAEVARGSGTTLGGSGASDAHQIAKLAKETTKMDDFAALMPPLVAFDELSPDENRFVLQFLLEKMKIYQQRIALLFQNNSRHALHVGVFGSPTTAGGKHRDLISKQLGVELPPIAQVPASGSAAGGGSSMSPLKQKRRMFAHVTSSVAAAMEGEPGTNQSNLEPNRKPALAAAGHHSLQSTPPNNSLLAMATNQFNFLSMASVQTGKNPMKSQLSSQTSPSNSSNMKSSSHTRAIPNGSPVKTGIRKVQPQGNTSIFAKKAHLGHAGSATMTTSTESIVLDGMSLLQSRDMLTAWSNSSIPTLADSERATLEE